MTSYIYNSLLYIHHNKGQPRFFKSGMAAIGYKRLLDSDYITPFGEESEFFTFSLKLQYKNLSIFIIFKNE